MPPAKIIPFPQSSVTVSPRSAPLPQPKKGFTLWQWLVLLVLIGTACVVSCGVCAVVGSFAPPPQSQAIAPLPAAPKKPFLEGLTFAVIGSKPFDVQDKTIRPSGRFWLVEVAVYNPTDKPIQITTYNIFLKDRQNREIWYHHDLTYLHLKNPVTADIKPGQTVQVALVYDIPTDANGDLSLNYNGAEVWFSLAQ